MIINEALVLLGLKGLSYSEKIWMLIGLLGQLVFFSRWIIQWLSSEKNKSSIIPVAFWWLSFIGGLIILVYAYHIGSFPFLMAQCSGIIVYSRNLILIYKIMVLFLIIKKIRLKLLR